MFYSTRFKLIVSFLAVSLIAGSVSLLVGTMLLYRAVLNEATTRVSLDLNAARELYQARLNSITSPLAITSVEPHLYSELVVGERYRLITRLERLAKSAHLDFAGLVNSNGITIARENGEVSRSNAHVVNPIVRAVLERRVPVSGTVVMNRDELAAESLSLAEQARIQLIPTPRAAPRENIEETAGMALAAAVPIMKQGRLLGVIYGGILLSRNTEIVDRIRNTVFQNEVYSGRNIGTATIFFDDLRIATNVLTAEGKRAIGTRVSQEVKEHVLGEGKKWTAPAFVVSNWYITAYEPIEDIFNRRVGMLYVGVLEEKYADIRWKALSVLMIITIAGMLLSIGLGYYLADKILKPLNRLIQASKDVSEGNLSVVDVGPISKDEIGLLQRTFYDMIFSLQDRDMQRMAESEIRLIQSEKQASIGRLAAGVAHEINNPLTGVLTYTHMLLRRKDLEDDVRSDLQTISNATERVRKIVKGLLDFSRQTKLNPEPTDVNVLVNTTINLLQNQALVKGVNLSFNPGDDLPMLTLDPSQLQSVLINIIINAFDAIEPGGTVTVATGIGLLAQKEERKGVEIVIADTGCGISPQHLDKLFDPFFTTKEVGQGTGLGLAVSYGIIERHGGTIMVQSDIGKGSIFTIWLPIEGENE